MNKLLALADRVEKLTGPDREVDIQIELALGLVPEPYERAVCHGVPQMYFWDREDNHAPYVTPERYTELVDDAMLLVPADRRIGLVQEPSGGWQCAMLTLGSDDRDQCMVEHIKSPALALTCAALRARAHGGGEG